MQLAVSEPQVLPQLHSVLTANGETALIRGVMNPECGSIFKLLVEAKV